MRPKKRHPLSIYVCSAELKTPAHKVECGGRRPERKGRSLLSSRNCSSSGQRKISTHDRIWMTHKKTNTSGKNSQNADNQVCLGVQQVLISCAKSGTHIRIMGPSIIMWSTLLYYIASGPGMFGRRLGLNTPLCDAPNKSLRRVTEWHFFPFSSCCWYHLSLLYVRTLRCQPAFAFCE